MFTAQDVVAALDALDAEQVEAVVDGGWAVDALVGSQRRAHDDLDLVVLRAELDRLCRAVAPLGYAVVTDEPPARVVLAAPDDRRIDVHLTQPVEGGWKQEMGGDAAFTYPDSGLKASGHIGGRTVRCLNAATQVLCHAGYEPDDDDRSDMAALAAVTGESLPPPYARGPASANVRVARPSDVAGACVVRRRSWRYAYRGLMPRETIDQQDLGLGYGWAWGRVIEPPSDLYRFLVGGPPGEVHGFADIGPCRDPECEGARVGEVNLLYLDPTALGSGLGKALLDESVTWFGAAGVQRLHLWTLRGNERARRFYEREGWVHDGTEKTTQVPGGEWVEVRYIRSA